MVVEMSREHCGLLSFMHFHFVRHKRLKRNRLSFLRVSLFDEIVCLCGSRCCVHSRMVAHSVRRSLGLFYNILMQSARTNHLKIVRSVLPENVFPDLLSLARISTTYVPGMLTSFIGKEYVPAGRYPVKGTSMVRPRTS